MQLEPLHPWDPSRWQSEDEFEEVDVEAWKAAEEDLQFHNDDDDHDDFAEDDKDFKAEYRKIPSVAKKVAKTGDDAAAAAAAAAADADAAAAAAPADADAAALNVLLSKINRGEFDGDMDIAELKAKRQGRLLFTPQPRALNSYVFMSFTTNIRKLVYVKPEVERKRVVGNRRSCEAASQRDGQAHSRRRQRQQRQQQQRSRRNQLWPQPRQGAAS